MIKLFLLIAFLVMLASTAFAIVESDVIWRVLEVNGQNVYPDNTAKVGDSVSARGMLINQSAGSTSLVYELKVNGAVAPFSIHVKPGQTTLYVEFNFIPTIPGNYECIISDTSDRSRLVLWRVEVR